MSKSVARKRCERLCGSVCVSIAGAWEICGSIADDVWEFVCEAVWEFVCEAVWEFV